MSTRFRATLSRVGTQSYPEGIQHRAAADVFDPESLRGLDGLRVQVSHDPNAPAIGRVVPGSVTHDETHVIAVLEIADAATIAGIRAGHIKEISLQYTAEIETDSQGNAWQRKIRFTGPGAHVALLDVRRERARCGATCSIAAAQDSMTRTQRTADGGSITLDAASACTCSTSDQAEYDRWQARLDHASTVHGVAKSALVSEMIRIDGADAEITIERINNAAARLLRPGSYVHGDTSPAQYVDGRRAQRADVNANDDAFRASLAAKLQRDDRADADDEATNVPTVASLKAGALAADADFSAHLARLASRGAAE